MKRNNLPIFFTKAALFCVATVLTPTAAFAQITLDLGVLSDDPVTEVEKTTTSAPVKKSEPAKPAAKPKPATPAAKPVVKKTQKAQKKETVQVKEKYQVKETRPKDEHDRLKPHRAPVPDVKVLASSNGEVPEEETLSSVKGKVAKGKSSFKEPKLSKHFLKQQKLNEQKSPEEENAASPVEQARDGDAEKRRVVTPQQLKYEALRIVEKTAGTEVKTAETPVVKPVEPVAKAVAEAPAAKPVEPVAKQVAEDTAAKPEVKEAVKEPEKTVLTFSVFPVDETLTQAERSAVLMKEIPSDSATYKVLSDKKSLYDILRFEPKTLELTPEMQTALDKIALLLKKDRKKRMLIYAYAQADPSEPGKERQYALRRALMVRSYLIVQGIHSLRMELRSQGQKGAGNVIPDRTDLVLQDR